MSTLDPRPPYSASELAKLYPAELQLTNVQVLLRHGERTPVNSRFQNTGLHPHWPYCSSVDRLRSVVRNADGDLDSLTWRRRLESLGKDDGPTFNLGPKGEEWSVCQPGELTDKGRETTLALGRRIRTLYVDQLRFLPAMLDADTLCHVTLRTTPVPRARESTEQAFTGLYPASTRTAHLPPPTIATRTFSDETLFPNENACKRFAELAQAFADRTAKLYNHGPEMAYINKKLAKWMPSDSPAVKVDSHPRLSGIMDTTNATLAHGKDTRLPSEFYDPKLRADVDRIVTEEWFVGYQESNEYRTLGIGAAVGDLTQKMVEHVRSEGGGRQGSFKISLNGCHDTTIAATLTALGAFRVDEDKWPNFTSNIAFELFKTRDHSPATPSSSSSSSSGAIWPSQTNKTWFSTITAILSPSTAPVPTSSPRAPLASLPASERESIDNDYFVRIRYNDRPVTLPACEPAGRHWRDDASFCTLAAFKQATDSFTPADWKRECGRNLGRPAMGEVVERPPGVS